MHRVLSTLNCLLLASGLWDVVRRAEKSRWWWSRAACRWHRVLQIQGTHSWAVGDRGHLRAPCRTELFAQGGHHDPDSSPLGWPDLQLDRGNQRREVSHSKPQILLSAAPGFSLPSRLSLNTTAQCCQLLYDHTFLNPLVLGAGNRAGNLAPGALLSMVCWADSLAQAFGRAVLPDRGGIFQSLVGEGCCRVVAAAQVRVTKR